MNESLGHLTDFVYREALESINVDYREVIYYLREDIYIRNSEFNAFLYHGFILREIFVIPIPRNVTRQK